MRNNHAIAEEFKEYAYSVSHDVSAPVRAMVEFSKLLTREPANALSADGKEYLGIIIENGQKLQAMMDGLLQYSRLNTLAKEFTAVNMQQVLERACLQLQNLIAQYGAQMTIEAMPNVWADGDQLQQLWVALIHNALLFQPRGQVPQIHIRMDRLANFWYFSITDNGIGVQTKKHGMVFQLFKRMHTEDEYPGFGLGLAMAKKIVEHHGGRISYEPVQPHGTTFFFTLPYREIAP